MRIFLCLLLTAISLSAQVPSFKDFLGTNGIVIRTNGNKVQVDGAAKASLSDATNIVNAAQVWTNPPGSGLVFPANITNGITLGTNSPDFGLSLGFPYTLFIQAICEGNVQPIYFSVLASAGDGAKEGLFVNLPRSDAFTGQDSTAGYFATSLDGAGGNKAIYNYGVMRGVKGQTGGGYVRRDSQGVGVIGIGALSTTNINYGVIGVGANSLNASTNVGVAGTGISYGGTGIHVGVYGEVTSTDATDPHYEQSAGLFDSRDLGDPILTLRTNNGTFKAAVFYGTKTTNATPLDVAAVISGFSGFANYSTLATNAVTPTGVTNTAIIDRQAFVTATASSFTINDRSGAVLYTSPVLTATLNIRLQPGWSVRAASGLVGTVIP